MFLCDLLFSSLVPRFQILSQIWWLYTEPKTRDQTMTGDETGHGTGEDFMDNFIM
jgi:hypothetical protein